MESWFPGLHVLGEERVCLPGEVRVKSSHCDAAGRAEVQRQEVAMCLALGAAAGVGPASEEGHVAIACARRG